MSLKRAHADIMRGTYTLRLAQKVADSSPVQPQLWRSPKRYNTSSLLPELRRPPPFSYTTQWDIVFNAPFINMERKEIRECPSPNGPARMREDFGGVCPRAFYLRRGGVYLLEVQLESIWGESQIRERARPGSRN